MDNHPALQEWYSSILNRYFSVLLDNAQKYGEQQDPAFAQGMNNLVNKGRALIAEFNENWGVLPDQDFQGPPADEVERINRMPVKYSDHYNKTTSHSPSFDAMANNIIYYVMSSSPTFIQKYKTQSPVTDNPDDKSTRFTFVKNNKGDVRLRINWWDGKQWTYVELPFEIDITSYKNLTKE